MSAWYTQTSFACDYGGDRNASRLCFSGSTCNVTVPAVGESFEYCVCPPGYSADNTLGHFPNCALPDAALPAMFGILTVIYLLAAFYTVPEYFLMKSKVKQLMWIILAQGLLNYLMVLSVFVDRGFFEASAILNFLSYSLISLTMIQMNLMTSLPIFAMFKRSATRLKVTFYSIVAGTILAQLTITVFLFMQCRDADPTRYNKAMLIFQYFNNFSIIALSAANSASLMRLRSTLRSSNGEKPSDVQMEALLERIDAMVKSSGGSVVLFLILMIYPITWTILRSFPGQYILFFFLYSTTPLYMVQATMNFKIQNTETLKNRTSKRLSRQNNREGTADSKSNHSSKTMPKFATGNVVYYSEVSSAQ